tara:strand:- start:348 stop:719 length:372 start_codon:yes stop_codon:yes gene_type:complete
MAGKPPISGKGVPGSGVAGKGLAAAGGKAGTETAGRNGESMAGGAPGLGATPGTTGRSGVVSPVENTGRDAPVPLPKTSKLGELSAPGALLTGIGFPVAAGEGTKLGSAPAGVAATPVATAGG